MVVVKGMKKFSKDTLEFTILSRRRGLGVISKTSYLIIGMLGIVCVLTTADDPSTAHAE
jgi:hypothetical protein